MLEFPLASSHRRRGLVIESGDDDLIQGMVRRDVTALTDLDDRYGSVAFALAYRVLDDAATAEEVVQDAFLLAWRHAPSFDTARSGSLRAWLLTIVHHRAIDARRRLARRREIVGLEAIEEMLAVPGVWDEVALGLERDEIRAAVGALPESQRHAIALAFFDGLTHREIAERTGIPLGTVKSRLRLGLEKLHGALSAARAQRGGERAVECDSAQGGRTPSGRTSGRW